MKLLAYKWTCLFGLAFLGAFLWEIVSSGGVGDLFVLVFSLAFLASLITSIVTVVTRRSRADVNRVVLNVAFCILLYPVIRLAGVVQDKVFLTRLPRFQKATDTLIRNEGTKANSDASTHVVSLPPGFSDLNVLDNVLISSPRGNITVRYAVKNSNALSHRGFMYRSDDSESALGEDYPNMGYTHLAPHWFFFSQ